MLIQYWIPTVSRHWGSLLPQCIWLGEGNLKWHSQLKIRHSFKGCRRSTGGKKKCTTPKERLLVQNCIWSWMKRDWILSRSSNHNIHTETAHKYFTKKKKKKHKRKSALRLAVLDWLLCAQHRGKFCERHNWLNHKHDWDSKLDGQRFTLRCIKGKLRFCIDFTLAAVIVF